MVEIKKFEHNLCEEFTIFIKGNRTILNFVKTVVKNEKSDKDNETSLIEGDEKINKKHDSSGEKSDVTQTDAELAKYDEGETNDRLRGKKEIAEKHDARGRERRSLVKHKNSQGDPLVQRRQEAEQRRRTSRRNKSEDKRRLWSQRLQQESDEEYASDVESSKPPEATPPSFADPRGEELTTSPVRDVPDFGDLDSSEDSLIRGEKVPRTLQAQTITKARQMRVTDVRGRKGKKRKEKG